MHPVLKSIELLTCVNMDGNVCSIDISQDTHCRTVTINNSPLLSVCCTLVLGSKFPSKQINSKYLPVSNKLDFLSFSGSSWLAEQK